jgi:hypothetical protein
MPNEVLGIFDSSAEAATMLSAYQIDQVPAGAFLVVVPPAGLRAVGYHRERAITAKAQFVLAGKLAIGFSQQRNCYLGGTARQRRGDGLHVEASGHGDDLSGRHLYVRFVNRAGRIGVEIGCLKYLDVLLAIRHSPWLLCPSIEGDDHRPAFPHRLGRSRVRV